MTQSPARTLIDKIIGATSGTLFYTTDPDVVYAVQYRGYNILYDKTGRKAFFKSVPDEAGETLYKYVISTGQKTAVTPVRTDCPVMTDTMYAMYDIMDNVIAVLAYANVSSKLEWDKPTVALVESFDNTEYWNKIGSVNVGYPSKTVGLIEESLSLYASASDVIDGARVFANEYIEGEFEASTITASEETEINNILDEIIGGV